MIIFALGAIKNIPRSITSGTLYIFLLSFLSISYGKDNEISISPNDDRLYRVLTLPNNMEVMLISDTSVENSTAALSVGVGSMQDPVSQPGLAHFLEHMLFLGTERFPQPGEFQKFVADHAGYTNAMTSGADTTYIFSISNSAYAQALEHFSSFFTKPLLLPEYVDKELNAVHSEWQLYKNEDAWAALQLNLYMKGDHPLNRFTIGNLNTLVDKDNSALYQELKGFYQTYYSSNIMKLVMISNQTLDDMEYLVNQYFSEVANKDIEKPALFEPLPDALKLTQRIHFKSVKDNKYLKLTFRFSADDEHWTNPTAQLITYLLGSEMPGTPAFLLQEKGWVSSLASYHNRLYDYGEITIGVTLTKEGEENKEAISAIIMQYLSLLKDQGISMDYFNELQLQLDNEFRFLQKKDDFSYATSLARRMHHGKSESVIIAPYHLGIYDKNKIEALLNQLNPQTLMIWHWGPDEQAETPIPYFEQFYRVERVLESEMNDWEKKNEALYLPSLNRYMAKGFIVNEVTKVMDKPERVCQSRGFEFWMKNSKNFSHLPNGLLTINLNDHRVSTDIKVSILWSVWADMIMHKHAALWDELNSAGIKVSIFPMLGMYINIEGFTERQEDVLTKILNCISDDFSDQDFVVALDRFIDSVRNKNKRPAYQQSLAYLSALMASGNFDDEDMLSVAKELSFEEFNLYKKERLISSPIRAMAYGNYAQSDINRFSQMIQKKMIPDNRDMHFQPTQYIKPVPGQTVSVHRDTPLDNVAVSDVYIHSQPGFDQRAVLYMLKKHLNQAVFNSLRTEKQLGYVVFGFDLVLKDYAGIGITIETSKYSPEMTQLYIDQFIASYTESLKQLNEVEFNQLKSGVLNEILAPPKNLNEEASHFFLDLYSDNQRFDSRENFIAALTSLSCEKFKMISEETLLSNLSSRFNVQVRGAPFSESMFSSLKNEEKVTNFRLFHQQATHQIQLADE